MMKAIEHKHKGIALKITPRTYTKDGTVYTEYQIRDYTSGRLVRHSRVTLADAKAKAEEIAEQMVSGRAFVREPDRQDAISAALEAIRPYGLRIDAACLRLAEALKILDGNAYELLVACAYYRDHRGDRPLSPKPFGAAGDDYLAQRESKVSATRYKTESNCFEIFKRTFGTRLVSEIQAHELDDLTRARDWSKRTRNDNLCTLAAFWRWCIARNMALENPAAPEKIQRDRKRGGSSIGTLTPQQARLLLCAVADDLKPFVSLWLFSGLRAMEIARMSYEAVQEGLKSGAIYLPAKKAKTGVARDVPLADNLKAWLRRYAPASGHVPPARWYAADPLEQSYRLSALTRHLKRKAGGTWTANGPRHSFGSFHLKLHGDPAETRSQMGTSLDKLERNYASRARSITPETALEYFSIVPSEPAEIIPMPEPAAVDGAEQYMAAGANVIG